MREQVAEYVAAFANADGGVLLLGVEDDREVTGHGLPSSAVESLLDAPRARLDPPQPPGFTVSHKGVELIVFDVPAADAPVQMTGNGFPLRVGDQTVRARETQIAATKQQGMYESWESRRSSCSVADLDPKLLARARAGAGLSALSDEEYLLKRKLADQRGRRIVLRRAAELLFARQDPDHPNAALRSVTGLDTLRASHLLRGLRDRELLTLQGRGADSFYTLTPVVRDLALDRGELSGGSRGAVRSDRGELPADRGELLADRGELPADRGELTADRGELPEEVQRALDGLGLRPRKERLRAVIEAICAAREWTTPGEIARFLSFSQRKLSGRHLTPMVEAGRLMRRYPDNLTHPEQAYRANSSEASAEKGTS